MFQILMNVHWEVMITALKTATTHQALTPVAVIQASPWIEMDTPAMVNRYIYKWIEMDIPVMV